MSEATGTITESTRARLLVGAPVQEQTVVAAGVDTAVLQGGDGPPMVLLHGPGESAVVWIPVLDELVRRHRVIAADLPGHGASAVPPEEMDRRLDRIVADRADRCHLRRAAGARRPRRRRSDRRRLRRHPSHRGGPPRPRRHHGARGVRSRPAVRTGHAAVLGRSVRRNLRAVHEPVRLRPRHRSKPARPALGAVRPVRRRTRPRAPHAGGVGETDRACTPQPPSPRRRSPASRYRPP